jgi:cell division protein FtsN
VSPERDDPTAEQEYELYEDVPPRSIFAATWFRVVLVVIVLGVIGAVAVPYVLDWMSPPPPSRSAGTTKSSLTSTTTSSGMSAVADKSPSSSERSTSEKPGSDKPSADKRASPLGPAPGAPSLAATPARPETKSESPSTAKTAIESKSSAKSTVPEAKASPSVESKTAMAVTESPARATAAKPTSPKAEAATKPDVVVKGDATPATATKPSATRQAAAKATTPSPPPAIAGGAPYWVQVGAFKDSETAKRVARQLRDENFKVEESLKGVAGTTAPAAKTPAAPAAASSSDQYDVFVSGAPVEELNRRLAGKGLTADGTSSGSFLVKPSLPLRDAVALSKDLAVDGLKVQVRRAGITADAPATPAPLAAVESGGPALHRVRVGSFADKGAAQAAARELEAKGYKPYIARGDQ